MRAHVCIQTNMAAKSRPFEIVDNKKVQAKAWSMSDSSKTVTV